MAENTNPTTVSDDETPEVTTVNAENPFETEGLPPELQELLQELFDAPRLSAQDVEDQRQGIHYVDLFLEKLPPDRFQHADDSQGNKVPVVILTLHDINAFATAIVGTERERLNGTFDRLAEESLRTPDPTDENNENNETDNGPERNA